MDRQDVHKYIDRKINKRISPTAVQFIYVYYKNN